MCSLRTQGLTRVNLEVEKICTLLKRRSKYKYPRINNLFGLHVAPEADHVPNPASA